MVAYPAKHRVVSDDQFAGWSERQPPRSDGKTSSWLAQSDSKNAVRARAAVFAAGTALTSGGAVLASHLMGY